MLVGFAAFTIFGLVGVLKILIPEYTMSSSEHPEHGSLSDGLLVAKQHEGYRDLIRMGAAWLVCVPLFLVHFNWARTLARRERFERSSRKRYPQKRRPQQRQPQQRQPRAKSS